MAMSPDGAPDDQDPCNPDTGADPVQQQIAGDLKKEIAEKEDPADQSELLAGNPQLLIHGQRGKVNVGAIQMAREIKQKNIRNDSQTYFSNGPGFDGSARSISVGEHEPSLNSTNRPGTLFSMTKSVWVPLGYQRGRLHNSPAASAVLLVRQASTGIASSQTAGANREAVPQAQDIGTLSSCRRNFRGSGLFACALGREFWKPDIQLFLYGGIFPSPPSSPLRFAAKEFAAR
jgi:hypothetical protein